MYFHMRASRHIRSALTEDMDAALAVNLFSHVWTTQTLFCSKNYNSNIKKLQRAQNTLARIVLPNLQSTPVASLLLWLHWLPVISRIKYKVATIIYKSLSVAQPTYLHLILQQCQPTRSLRSGSQNLLALPTKSSEFGRHAFSYCATSAWNIHLISQQLQLIEISFKNPSVSSSLIYTVLLPPSDRPHLRFKPCAWLLCALSSVCMYVW